MMRRKDVNTAKRTALTSTASISGQLSTSRNQGCMNRLDFWSYAKAVLVILVMMSFIPLSSAQSIPIEDLKTYQLIELWDTIPQEEISPSGNPVRSFRQVTPTYTRQNAIQIQATMDIIESFSNIQATQTYTQELNQDRLGAVPVDLYMWNVNFQNTDYPKYEQDRGKLDLVIPPVDGPTPTTLLHIDLDREDFIIQQGQAELQRAEGGTLIIASKPNTTISLITTQELTADIIDSVKLVSFSLLPPPPEPEVPKPVVIQAPAPLQEEPENPLPIIMFAVLGVLVVAGTAVGLLRVQKQHKAHIQYTPHDTHISMTTQGISLEPQKKNTAFIGHVQDMLKHIKKK